MGRQGRASISFSRETPGGNQTVEAEGMPSGAKSDEKAEVDLCPAEEKIYGISPR